MSHPEPTRLIAVRHGETAWNVESRLQGQLDIPLNERGLEQARRTAHWLAEDKPDVVISSDLARARATAQAIAALAIWVRKNGQVASISCSSSRP